jgi:hypothetical protein
MVFSLSLSNVSNGRDTSNFFALISAAILIEAALLACYRLFPQYWGNLINVIYSNFNITIVIIDILVVLIAFGITQQIYSYIFGNSQWNILVFILIFATYQLVRLAGYYYVLQNVFKDGYNTLIDFQKAYYSKYTTRTLFGDLSMAVVVPILVALFKNFDYYILFDITLIGLYIICYIIISTPTPTIPTPLELESQTQPIFPTPLDPDRILDGNGKLRTSIVQPSAYMQQILDLDVLKF